jgi:hypothetical protein
MEATMEKAKHYAVSLGKKNDQLMSAEIKLQKYQNMCIELVDEESDAQKTAKVEVCVTKKLKINPSNV